MAINYSYSNIASLDLADRLLVIDVSEKNTTKLASISNIVNVAKANISLQDLRDVEIQNIQNGDLLVWNNTSEYWFNDSTLNVDYASGNVGIGTNSPNALGSDITTLDIRGANGGGVRFGVSEGSESTFFTIAAGGYLGTISNIPLYFQTNNSVKATILANGDVGIGTVDPSAKLEVNGNIKADSFIKDGGTSNQFLKADGSVDATSYFSADSAYNKAESDSIFTSKTLSQNISFGESYASNYKSRVVSAN